MRSLRLGGLTALLVLTSACAYVPTEPPGPVALQLGIAASVSGGANAVKYFTVTIGVDEPGLRVRLTGGTGNADLYVRVGERPTTIGFDCRSDAASGDEECFIATPVGGTWHIAVLGIESFSGKQLIAESAAGPTPTVSVGDSAIAGLRKH